MHSDDERGYDFNAFTREAVLMLALLCEVKIKAARAAPRDGEARRNRRKRSMQSIAAYSPASHRSSAP